VPVGYKWGYGASLPIAEITNTHPKNVFYNSFEDETTNVVPGGKTGLKSSVNAAYVKALSSLDPGSYILSYHKWETNKWVYYETPATVPAGGTYTINLATVAQYDEIRFHPKEAQVKTYTYNTLGGLTSATDPNGKTTYYLYDDFNRLKLIRDDNDHIVKAYDYLYKIQN
jgi:YD repeat-containing protein